jgi:cell division protein FtsQ
MAKEAKKTGGIRWGRWFGLAGAAALCVSTAWAARSVHRYMLSDPQFALARGSRALRLEGVVYAPRGKVERVFAGDFERSVFSVPLAERRRRLLAIDWVEDASVARVWPDRLVVRIRERQPVAFVSLRPGVLLIDRHGVLLEPPPQARFTFPVLSGIQEDQPELLRAERVRAMLELLEQLGPASKDVSEVNTGDPDNLRLVTQAGGRAVELMMGDANFARRYQTFLSHYPEIARRSPNVRTFDLRLDNRILTKD